MTKKQILEKLKTELDSCLRFEKNHGINERVHAFCYDRLKDCMKNILRAEGLAVRKDECENLKGIFINEVI